MNWKKVCLSVGLALGVLVCTGGAETVDDFTDDVLNVNWVQSTVLTFDPTNGTSPTFDTTTNNDQLTVTSGVAGKQEILLRDDYSLNVGWALTTDFVSLSTPPDGNMLDAGISIATATGITERRDCLYCRVVLTSTGQHRVQLDYFNNTDQVVHVLDLDDFSDVAGLYIERTSVNTYDAGYINVLGMFQSVQAVEHTGDVHPGAAVGYYADMRYEGETAVFDNFCLDEGGAEPLPGDANLDNVVNDQDASILAAHWQAGPGAAWGDGDFNDDGFVNDQDASILAANWQETQEGAAAVPEPSTFVLAICGLIGLAAFIRRRK